MKPLEEKTRLAVNLLLTAAFLMFAASWGYWKFQYADKPKLPVINLQVSTGSQPVVKSYLPEQRRKFALEFGKKFKGTLTAATVTTRGDFHKLMVIRGSSVNEQLVQVFKANTAVIDELREMGFKHLILTDDKTVWDIDLKN